jgi:hypothetical protein
MYYIHFSQAVKPLLIASSTVISPIIWAELSAGQPSLLCIRQFQPLPEKILRDEVPGEQLRPIVGRTHGSGFLKYAGQVLGWIPVVRLRRFYQCI